MNTATIHEDEIDLRELFKTLWGKRVLIVLFTSTITLCAVVFALLQTPIYQVKANVRIGYIGTELIENTDIITKMLNIVFHVQDKAPAGKESLAAVSSVSSTKNLRDFIEIKTEGISNKEALAKNMEVVNFLQDFYQPKIDEYVREKSNAITNAQNALLAIDNFERKNIDTQIEILKTQKIASIDEEIEKLLSQDIVKLERQIQLLETQKIVKINEEIEKLLSQDIVKLERQIQLLETQKIVKINEEIEFLLQKKIPSLEAKVAFYKNNLEQYTKEIKNLYSQSKSGAEATIVSIQMVNYQNLILNARNSIEDLNLQILDIHNNQIPSLQRERENIEKVAIRDLELQIENIRNITIVNLQRERENIEKVAIRDLELQIENIRNITIVNLQREREKLTNDAVRKLEYARDVELENKKLNLEQTIKRLVYEKSPQNIQNSAVVGDYVVRDHPIKPKKKLIVVVGFVTGFIVSIFLVFLLSFFKQEEHCALTAQSQTP